ncbi:MAG: alpha/beta hydrolase [Silicimonas sp.]|nr:alpha/beta hydrolase [Silicimonas sp.]
MSKAPLALIHCGLGRASNWRPFLNALGGDISPLSIELPGHGLAEDYDETRDFSDQAVEIALDEMPSTPVPLIGHSVGAVVALRIAIERPYRVSSLVLIEPVFFAAVKGRWAHDKISRDLASFGNKVSAGEYATAVKEFHKIWGDGRAWSDISMEERTYMTSRIGIVPAANPLLWDDRVNLLRDGRLEGLEVPVTFIDGENTHPVVPEIISTIGDRIPNAEWVSVKGAGHMVPITHPEQVVKAVEGRLFVEAT